MLTSARTLGLVALLLCGTTLSNPVPQVSNGISNATPSPSNQAASSSVTSIGDDSYCNENDDKCVDVDSEFANRVNFKT
ncbi:hypothetical protein BDV3_005574 [Batrachochytrium dendrobatidis]